MILKNETIEAILTRRSIRSFSETPVSKDILETLAECGRHAPSGMGLQTWKFTVVTNGAVIREICRIVEKELDRPGYDMYRPTALIIPSNEKSSPYGPEDNACALENIFLAARSLGVGSVWINQLRNICDVPELRSLFNRMEIPADHVVFGIAALGYPADGFPGDKERKGIVHWVE